MKIRALVDDDSYFLGFRKGDVFEAELDLSKESYIFIDKDGDRRVRFVGDFEVVNEEAEGMTDNINGMSKTRLSLFADSLKDLTYKEMRYVSGLISDEIGTYVDDVFNPADVLVTVADNILEELNESK